MEESACVLYSRCTDANDGDRDKYLVSLAVGNPNQACFLVWVFSAAIGTLALSRPAEKDPEPERYGPLRVKSPMKLKAHPFRLY